MARNSFRDPVTGVLKAHGFVQTNAPGDIAQPEADDFNLQPGLWQWNGTQWVAFVPPPQPNESQLEAGLKALGMTLVQMNALLAKWPLFLWAANKSDWPVVQAIIAAAHTAGDITDQQYQAIKTLVAQAAIPVTLQ